MTDLEIEEHYANLLLLQYRGKPKAYATVLALVKPVIMQQLPQAVNDAFDINTAIGTQLDVLGKYLGLSRYGYDFAGQLTLTDDQYRTMLEMMIVYNQMGDSLYDIQTFLVTYFPNCFLVFDYQNMHMSYFYTQVDGANVLAEFFFRANLLPRPMGVGIGFTVDVPTTNNFFGCRTYDLPAHNVHGFNTYTAYDTGCPILDYDYALTF